MKNIVVQGKKQKSSNYQLPCFFRYDAEQESIDQYLTRAAIWIDQINHCSVEELGYINDSLLDSGLIITLKNYVFSVMNPLLEDLARKNRSKLVRIYQYEEFTNEFRIQVWNAFYRFNNPRYRKDAQNCQFTTFASHYLRQAAWRVAFSQYGITDYSFRICMKIMTAEQKLASALAVDPDHVTDQDIHEHIISTGGKNISVIVIRRIRNLMKPVSEIPDSSYVMDEWDTDQRETDIRIIELLENFLSRYHALQVFVFLQNYGFCSTRYRDMPVNLLVRDPLFLELCRSDLAARKRIRTVGKNPIRTQELKSRKATRSRIDVSHMLKEKYIFNLRLQIRDEFSEFLKEHDLKPHRLRYNLEFVMNRAWENLVLLYEIQDDKNTDSAEGGPH